MVSSAASTPPFAADPVTGERVEIHVPVGGHEIAACGDGGQRIAAHEGVPAPPLATLHGLQQEPGAGALGDLEIGGHRRERVGHQLAPDRHHAVLGGQRVEPVRARAPRARFRTGWSCPGRRVAEGAVEAGAVARVAGAGALLVDDQQQHVAVTVVAHAPDVLAVAGRLALAPELAAGSGSRTSSVRSRGS